MKAIKWFLFAVFSLFILKCYPQDGNNRVLWGMGTVYINNLELNTVLEKNGIGKLNTFTSDVSLHFYHFFSDKVSLALKGFAGAGYDNPKLSVLSFKAGITRYFFDDIQIGIFYTFQTLAFKYTWNVPPVLTQNNWSNASAYLISLYNRSHLAGVEVLWDDVIVDGISLYFSADYVFAPSPWKSELYHTIDFPKETYLNIKLGVLFTLLE